MPHDLAPSANVDALPSRPALVFVAELARRGAFATTVDADQPVRAAWHRARAVHPWVEAPLGAYAGWLADRVDITDPIGSLRLLEVADVYLACALVHHDPGALRLLDAMLEEIEGSLTATVSSGAAAEVVQWLRSTMLIDEEPPSIQRLRGPFVESRPGLVRFGGDVPLSSWLSSQAVKRALHLERVSVARRRSVPEEISGLAFAP